LEQLAALSLGQSVGPEEGSDRNYHHGVAALVCDHELAPDPGPKVTISVRKAQDVVDRGAELLIGCTLVREVIAIRVGDEGLALYDVE